MPLITDSRDKTNTYLSILCSYFCFYFLNEKKVHVREKSREYPFTNRSPSRHQEEEEADKTKQAQIEQTYEKHQDRLAFSTWPQYFINLFINPVINTCAWKIIEQNKLSTLMKELKCIAYYYIHAWNVRPKL